MFILRDGRNELYQWDLNRQVLLNGPELADATEVHFCNRTDDCSLVVEVKDEGYGIRYAEIPNILLQDTYPIRVYAYCDCYTKIEQLFKIKPRTKPSDYTYTETEIKSYEYLENKLKQIEEQGWSDEIVTKSIHDYLYANPMTMYDDGQGNVSLEVIPDGQEVKY